jgi:hypothetical protein
MLTENPTGWRLYFGTEENPELSQDNSFAPTLSLDTVFVSSNCAWKRRVKTLRIDPIPSKGVYEIESITFFKKSKKDIETYLNGTLYNSHYPSKEEDGEIYVSFEPFKDFDRFLNLYYEWDDDTRTLMTEFDGNKYYWTENSNIVTIQVNSTHAIAIAIHDSLQISRIGFSRFQRCSLWIYIHGKTCCTRV